MNITSTNVPNFKKPLYPGHQNVYPSPSGKRSVSFLTLFIIVVLVFILSFSLFRYSDRIAYLFSDSVETSEQMHIWQEVFLSGILHADGDLISYTHTLSLSDTTRIGIKSRTLDINLYTGMVVVQWFVEKEFDALYIVEVSSISWSLAVTWLVDPSLWSWSGLYMPQIGIYFPAEFWQKYVLLNQWEDGSIKIQNLKNNQIILLSYFVCNVSDPNKNCSQLHTNIWSTAEKIVSSTHGDKIYKLEWVTSWFFSNANYYWYFINDVTDQEVIDLVDSLYLPTESYIKDNLIPTMQTLCTDWITSLMQVQNQSLAIDTNGLVVTLYWPTVNWSASCKIFVDPSSAIWGTKLSYISSTPTAMSTSVEEDIPSTTSLTDLDASVKQFPINIEKALTFTSSKWYSIVFPSSNIAYEALNVDETLDLPGVHCSSQMNVTKFADKATMNDIPKVKVYTCTIKWVLNNIWNSFIQKESLNWTKFLIQIMDSAWLDFAKNIAIQ